MPSRCADDGATSSTIGSRRLVTTHSSRPARRTLSSFQDDVKEMATLFHVTGGYTYVDPYGEALGYEDVFTKLEHASRHYEAIGLGKEHVKRIVR
jgi:hypothetical protein